jgi:hypothetical protein
MDGKPHARVRIRCILRSPQGELLIFGAFDRLILLGRILAVGDVEVPMRYLALRRYPPLFAGLSHLHRQEIKTCSARIFVTLRAWR